MPYGPSRCSITPEAPWRIDRLKLGEIEFNNRPQGLGERAVLLVIRQRVQPAGIFGLQLHGRGDGVVPPLDPGAPVGGAACADNGCASGVRGTIARLTFGAGQSSLTDGRGMVPLPIVGRNGFAEWCRIARAGVVSGQVYPFDPAGPRRPVGTSAKGDHHVAIT